MTAITKSLLLATVLAIPGACLAEEKTPPRKNTRMVFPAGSTTPEGVQVEVNGTRSKLDQSVSKTIDDFFAALQQKQIDAAYDQLTKGTKIAEKAEEVATLKSKTKQAVELFGDIQGSELVAVASVGAHLLSATYMSLGKDFPLRWRFYFYRSGDAWRLIDIRVDDRLADMFGEPGESKAKDWPR